MRMNGLRRASCHSGLRPSWTFGFFVLAVGTAACGTILGDFSDGRLTDGPDGSTGGGGGHDGDADGQASLAEGPEGSICVASGADIIDFAVDDQFVYWLQGRQNAFSLVKCDKGGGAPTTLAALPSKPEAVALLGDDVYWTVNEAAAAPDHGGVWRMSKTGQSLPDAAWQAYDHAGPIVATNDSVFVASHDGQIYAALANKVLSKGEDNPTSIAASATKVYWSNSTGIRQIVAQSATGLGTFWPLPRNQTNPNFVGFVSDTIFWATSTASGSDIWYGYPDNSVPPEYVNGPQGIAGIAAVDGNNVYWATANAVQVCANLDALCTPKPVVNLPDRVISRILVYGHGIYFAAKQASGTYIVQH